MSGFIDEAQIHLKAGDGGAGAVSFRREAHVPRGGPDGGDGGTGGDVWLVSTTNVSSLLAFKDHPHRKASSGVHGQGKAKNGARGQDIEVEVPEGTIVKNLDGEIIVQLLGSGQRWVAAQGGRGGRGNASFLSNRRRAPNFAEQGEVGEEHWFNLELKLFADVALVGFPNAGKSTLISVISSAKPKIANYPFTTLEPNLGVVRAGMTQWGSFGADRDFIVADIPGLIEGASTGKGLGHQFLRHIERTKVLLFLIDLSSETTPLVQEKILLDELGKYDATLLERPRLIVGSKTDVMHSDNGFEGSTISAVTGQGISKLLNEVSQLVKAVDMIKVEEPIVIHKIEPNSIFAKKIGEHDFVVTGKEALRAVAVNDLNNPAALDYVQTRLRKIGVDKVLKRAGAAYGDTVHIGSLNFTFEQD